MPRQRRVRSTILSGNLQVRKALTERRYISACGRRSARKPATAKGEALGEPLKNRTGSWLVRFIKAIIQPFCGVVCNILPNHIIILLPADNVVIIAPLPYRKSGPLRHMCLHLADDLRNSRLSRRFVKPQQQMNMIRHDDGLINRCVRVEFRDVPDGLCGIPAIARERQPVQRALATRKGHAASVRRQSRQRLRSERRYRRNWCMPLYRYPTRIAGAAPGEACRAPTTRHRCPACFSPSISGHNSPCRCVYMTIRHRGGDGGTWQRN